MGCHVAGSHCEHEHNRHATLSATTLAIAFASPTLLCRAAKQVVQASSGMQAFLDRLALFKARSAVQLEGMQYTIGDFRISLARAVQVGGL